MRLSKRMETDSQRMGFAYSGIDNITRQILAWASEAAQLEEELAHKSRLLEVSEKAHFKTIEENAMLKRETAGLNHLIDRVYELLTAEERE